MSETQSLREKIAALPVMDDSETADGWNAAIERVLALIDAHQPAPDAPKCWHPRTRHSMREGTVTCEVCGASISTFEPVPPPVVSHETPVHVTQTGLSDTDAPQQPAPDAVAEAAIADDDSLAKRISELGWQIHNLGCEYQNDEKLLDRLQDLRGMAWEIADTAREGAA